MTALFYQQSWSIIKKDVVDMVNNFIRTGVFDDRLNMTNICLIPKTARPNRMTELRPISLCNVGYKIISKVLCQHSKVSLQEMWVLIASDYSVYDNSAIIYQYLFFL